MVKFHFLCVYVWETGKCEKTFSTVTDDSRGRARNRHLFFIHISISSPAEPCQVETELVCAGDLSVLTK